MKFKILNLLAALLIGAGMQAQEGWTLWPGDVNDNGIVNNVDVLFWSAAFKANGPERTDQSSQWRAHSIDSAWPEEFPGGINFAYADCNGDGRVDNKDLEESIRGNFGLLHGELTPDEFISGTPGQDPPLRVVPLGNEVDPFDPHIQLAIRLGSSNIPVEDFAGVAFTLSYDPNKFSYSEGSFKGRGRKDISTRGPTRAIAFNKPEEGKLQVAIVLQNQGNLTGVEHSADDTEDDQIGSFSIVMEDIIFGLSPSENLQIQVEDAVLLNSDSEKMAVDAQPLNAIVHTNGNISVDLPETEKRQQALLYPNPPRDFVMVAARDGFDGFTEIEIYDLSGFLMERKQFDRPVRQERIQLDLYPDGMYIIRLKGKNFQQFIKFSK
ncbi:MAG: T9SS type A sorting domain-containing protein [Saprospiraceae bacterium]|nr:T9SS type A sorting domain-containing protein [Saprospiraceae bacterium]